MESDMGGASSIDGDWESICRMLSLDQDPDFTTFLGHGSIFDPLEADASPLPPLLELCTPNYFNIDQHNLLTPNWSYDEPISSFSSSIDIHTDKNDFLIKEVVQMQVEAPVPRKRVRVNSKDALKGKKKAKTKKSIDEEEEKSSKCYASDNESNDSQEGLETDIGKKRADIGAATDPQSLYARKRRERINERLKILQTLVPNGTKVDISTMLEEAVHYVKFMQMQIKLLSSDEMWMYAPLAYNGLDVGLFNNFSPYLLP